MRNQSVFFRDEAKTPLTTETGADESRELTARCFVVQVGTLGLIDAAEHPRIPIQLDKQDPNASSSDKAQKEHITRDGIIRDLYVTM